MPWLLIRTMPSARVPLTSQPGSGRASWKSERSTGNGSSGAVQTGWSAGSINPSMPFTAQYGDPYPEYDCAIAGHSAYQPRLSRPLRSGTPRSRKWPSMPEVVRRSRPGARSVAPVIAPIQNGAAAAKR